MHNERISMTEKDLIIAKLAHIDFVSFDVFDTLLLRDVLDPKDIFKIVPLVFKERTGSELGFNFFDERVESEYQARVDHPDQEDITFQQIYETLRKRTCIEHEIQNELMELEKELERKFIRKNPIMSEVYQYCLDSGKEIALISDMYHSEEFVRELLNLAGYDGIESLFVSSEVMKTKHSSTLFGYVQNECKPSKDSWFHIGDNKHADYDSPRRFGISAHLYVKVSDRENSFSSSDTISFSIIDSLYNNAYHTTTYPTYWERFGYEKVGRLFLAMFLWLESRVKDEYDCIHFLARDGYLLKKVYDKLSDENLPKSNYLYASRRAVQYAELINKKDKEITETLLAFNPQFAQKLTIKEVLDNLGLDVDEYRSQFIRLKFDEKTVLDYEDGTYGKACEFIISIMDDIKSVLRNEVKTLVRYFEDEGLYSSDRKAVFDVGWRGSIQKSLNSILDKKIYGYYFGLTSFAHSEISDIAEGYYFDKGNPPTAQEQTLNFIMIYELIFSAPHGSLRNFEDRNGKLTPVLEEIENSEGYEHLRLMQIGVLRFIEDVKKYIPFISELNAEKVLLPLSSMLGNPRYEDLFNFSQLQNVVGLGASEDRKNYVETFDAIEAETNREYLQLQVGSSLWPGVFLVNDNGRLLTNSEYYSRYSCTTPSVPVNYENVPNLEKLFLKKVFLYVKYRGFGSALRRGVTVGLRELKSNFIKNSELKS